jgi:hypothetical protein
MADDNPGAGTYVLAAERMDTRDDKKVLKRYRRGDKVELDDEQAQRLVASGAVMTQAEWDEANKSDDEDQPEAEPESAPSPGPRSSRRS